MTNIFTKAQNELGRQTEEVISYYALGCITLPQAVERLGRPFTKRECYYVRRIINDYNRWCFFMSIKHYLKSLFK